MAQARRRVLLWLVIAGGISLRVGWCWTHLADFTDDRDGYIAHAASVSRGDGYLGPYSHRPTAFRPPLYPIAIGLLQRSGCSAAVAVALINGLSSLAILFVPFGLLQGRFDSSGGGAVLILSLLWIAFDPLLIRYSSLPMTEVPCAALLLCAVTSFSRLLAATTLKMKAGRRAFLLAGVAGLLFALGALTRPVVLVACVLSAAVVVFGQLVGMRRNTLNSTLHRADRWNWIVLSTFMVLGCIIGMSPWVIRNQIHFGRFIPATTHGGYTLALGNNPDFYRDVIHGNDAFPWDGDALGRWQKRMIQQSITEGVPADSEIANDAWYYHQAKVAIQHDPSAFTQSCILRFHRFFAVSAADDYVSRAVHSAVSVWYASVWFGLIVNLFLLVKRRHEDSCSKASMTVGISRWMQVMLWSVVAAFVAMHLVYWTDTRMRAPVMPFLAILSATGWCSLQKLCEARYPSALPNHPSA